MANRIHNSICSSIGLLVSIVKAYDRFVLRDNAIVLCTFEPYEQHPFGDPQYVDMHADYFGKGFDQLLDVIDKINKKPDDEQIVLSAWNPFDLKEMALPPCHMFSQFYVKDGELSCQMYKRSADMGLSVSFNIASYSLLTYMIAQVCDLVPGDFTHHIGDAHVYRTHVRPLREQIQKQPKPFPFHYNIFNGFSNALQILKINPEKKDIDSFTASDFSLVGYDPHSKIEMRIALGFYLASLLLL
ncbi:hypothetical protein KFK09_003422 [Dendrobium nobile]|uniref:thymidylate synthase n=1 Tax=Dendrobium nobile TaxID=94219 RepID=A0A8T3C3E8_DENNO|nr:hypothetical protein KFK09_003422 [Dendrobium nobile]